MVYPDKKKEAICAVISVVLYGWLLHRTVTNDNFKLPSIPFSVIEILQPEASVRPINERLDALESLVKELYRMQYEPSMMSTANFPPEFYLRFLNQVIQAHEDFNPPVKETPKDSL